ncbi:ATP-dependent DNA ligase [Mycobacterium kansasii]
MLATAGAPPLGPGWTAEAKWDGARAASLVRPSGVELVSRPGNNFATRFPDVTSALQSALAGHTAILDGEIVALGNDGRPDFARLQRRLRAPRATSALRAAVPCHYFLFDCLHLDGVDLAGRAYVERRAALESLGLGREGLIVVPPCWPDLDGRVLLEVVKDFALEGVVMKRANSTYQAGRRSRAWIKVVIRRKAQLAVIGWASGRTEPVGALLVGGHDPSGRLVYCGTVSSGLSRAARRALFEPLRALEISAPAVTGLPAGAQLCHVRWTMPHLVGAVEYREFTGHLRHAAWKGLVGGADPAAVELPHA